MSERANGVELYPGEVGYPEHGFEAVVDQSLDRARVHESCEEIMSATVCPRCEKLGGVSGSTYRRIWECISCGAFGRQVPRTRPKTEGP